MNAQEHRARRLLVIISVVGVVIFLSAGGALWYLNEQADASLVTPTPTAMSFLPPSIITPPSSLEELATRFPEIAQILQDPALASAYKEFALAYQQGGIAAAEKLAIERGVLNAKREIRMTLIVDSPDNTPAVIAELQKMGVGIEGTYQDQIEIAVPMPLVKQIAKSDNPGKIFTQLGAIKHVVKLRMPVQNKPSGFPYFSEGTSTTGAEAWHRAGFTGKGIKIGILDLGFDGYKSLLGNTLPARVIARSFVSGVEPDKVGEVHGTACAEIVHAMAPDAELYLAYYGGSLAGKKAAVDWLLQEGVTIISHSAGSEVGPMDGTGDQAKFVDSIAAKGIVWINASGNEAQTHYRFTFNDANRNGQNIFKNGKNLLGIIPNTRVLTVVLNWDDWRGDSTEDYDLYVLDDKGTVVARGENTQQGRRGDQAFERVSLDVSARKVFYLMVVAKRITRPAVFNLYTHSSAMEFTSQSNSLSTPADARGALTVGAIQWRTLNLEPFSSQGPANDGNIKPDLVAPDDVTTRAYAPDTFPGTSAATPHVAGAAALVWSRFPRFSAAQVREYLESNAVDMGDPGRDPKFGAGRLNLPAPNPPAPATTQPTAPALPRPTGAPGTTQPTAPALPRPTSAPPPTAPPVAQPPATRTDSGLGATILILSVLMCGGVVTTVGGFTFLLVMSLRRGSTPRAVQPPQPPVPAPRQPPTPRATSLALVNPAGARLAIQMGRNQVGRSSQCAIHLDAAEVSRHHAVIEWDGARCAITDLGSSNGTLVNGRRLAPNVPQALQPGDTVSFGGVVTWQVVT